MRKLALLFCLLLSIFLSGCNMKQASMDATSLAQHLHGQIDREEFSAIYSEADPKYRKAMDENKSQALFRGIHKKLGESTKVVNTGVNFSMTPSGMYLRASFKTNYASGVESRDLLVWHKDKDQYRLVSWNITSEALILN